MIYIQIIILSLLLEILDCFIHIPNYSALRYSLSSNTKPFKDKEFNDLIRAAQDTLEEIINASKPDISKECYRNLSIAFTCQTNSLFEHSTGSTATATKGECVNHNESLYYITKLITDTSKSQNDLSTYSQCLRKINTTNQDPNNQMPFNISYLVVILDRIIDHVPSMDTDLTYLSKWSIFGICIPKICKDTEFRTVIFNGAYLFKDLTNITNELDTKAFVVDNDKNRIDWKDIQVYLHLIPLILLLIQLIIIIIGTLPCERFTCCCNNRKKRVNSEVVPTRETIIQIMDPMNLSNSGMINNINTSQSQVVSFPLQTGQQQSNPKKDHIKLYSLFNQFNLSDNGEEFFNFNATSKLNNISCLTYIGGIRGISMILLIFGNLFFALFNSASSIFFVKIFINMMASPIFSIFYFGLRYSPKILLSCSGYSLCFKLVCFLDEEFDEVKDQKYLIYLEKKKQLNEKLLDKANMSNSYNERSMNIARSERESVGLSDKFTEKQEVSDIQIVFLIKFILYQLHKYFIYVLMILFIKYSLNYLFIILKHQSPMWNYLQKEIIDSEYKFDTLKSILLLDPFLFDHGTKESLAKYSWFALCEIKSFFVSSLIIFIGYKYKMRFDIFIMILVVLLFIAKIIVFSLFFNQNMYFSTVYYYYTKYSSIDFGFIWNYNYFLIGIFFGFINYVIQKDLPLIEIITIEKRFLVRAAFIVKYFKEQKKQIVFILGLVGVLIIILLSFTIPITLFCFTELNQRSTILNHFMLIDGDVVVLLVQFSAFLFYIKGDNSISKFLSHSGWFILNKLYFSFILLLNPVILFVLYQSESRINLNIFNSIQYSFTCIVMIFIVASGHYIFVELPWKRVVKTIIQRRSERTNTLSY